MQISQNKQQGNIEAKLLAFKKEIRQTIQSGQTILPLSTLQKTFDFETLGYVNRAKTKISLSFKSIALITRLLQIVEIALSLIAKQQVITKRNLYYKLIHQYSTKYYLVDSDIEILCFNLDIYRQDLQILSSSRCLLFGNVTIFNNCNQLQCKSTVVTNLPTGEKTIKSQSSCKTLLIVQKQSALYQIHQQMMKFYAKDKKQIIDILENTIVVSSKGYPDNSSRSIIESLLPVVDQIFYLGDSDIYGLDILLCYSIAFGMWTNFVPRVKWIQLQKLVSKDLLAAELLPQKKQDKIKSIQILQKPYFKQLQSFIPANPQAKQFKQKMLVWKQKLKQIQTSNTKLQLQSLFKVMPENWIQQIFLSQNSI